MYVYCSIKGCLSSTKTEKGRRFFRFPKDEVRCKQWVEASGRPKLRTKDPKSLHSSNVVCDLHFQASDRLVRNLKRNAIPTLNLPNSQDNRISKDKFVDEPSREIIYKLYLFFLNEAHRFRDIENGYFLRVQERVAEATGLSREFIQSVLQEKDRLGSKPFKTPQLTGRPKQRNFDCGSEVETTTTTSVTKIQTIDTQVVTVEQPSLNPITYIKIEPVATETVPVEFDPVIIKSERISDNDSCSD